MKNVIVIVADSLRSDRLGCYGHHYDVSPNIDELAKSGVIYDDCWSCANCTIPSLTTIYTGLSPAEHGVVHHTLGDKFGEQAKFRAAGYDTIQSVLKKRGYTTVGFDWLSGFLADGFDKYYGILSDYLPSDRCERVTGTVARWVDSSLKTPFYWFIHFWDTHVPYPHFDYDAGRFSYPNQGISYETYVSSLGGSEPEEQRREWFSGTKDASEVMAWYDAALYRVDVAVGEIVKVLRAFLLLDDTRIIITGDHGESLVEHGIYFNHFGVYAQTLRVPLIVWESQISSGRVSVRASHTGVFDLAVGSEITKDDYILSCDGVGEGWWSVVDGDYHYLYLDDNVCPQEELYHLRDDKDELLNIASMMPSKCAELRNRIPGAAMG